MVRESMEFQCVVHFNQWDGFDVLETTFDTTDMTEEDISRRQCWIDSGLHDTLSLHWEEEMPSHGRFLFTFTVTGGYDYFGEYDEEWLGEFETIFMTGWVGRWQRVINKNLRRRQRKAA